MIDERRAKGWTRNPRNHWIYHWAVQCFNTDPDFHREKEEKRKRKKAGIINQPFVFNALSRSLSLSRRYTEKTKIFAVQLSRNRSGITHACEYMGVIFNPQGGERGKGSEFYVINPGVSCINRFIPSIFFNGHWNSTVAGTIYAFPHALSINFGFRRGSMTRVSGGREEGECWKILTNWLQFLVANDHHSPEIPFVAREKKDFSVHFFPRTMEWNW